MRKTHYTSGTVAPLCAALATLLAVAAPAGAQQPVTPPVLPRDVADSVVAFYNRASTVRFNGDVSLPAGTALNGDVAVLGGVLDLAGQVHGAIAVINGDLHLAPGARVDGAITVVGGSVTGVDSATVGGAVQTYGAVLRYRREGDHVEVVRPPLGAELAAGHEFPFGRTDFVVAVQGSYNRVEGLPIGLGPRARLGHANPTLLSARLIYRTSSGVHLRPDQLGYVARAEQQLGGRGNASISVDAKSVITPIEDNGVTSGESSLSTFFLHRDYRDHYESHSWGIGLHIWPARASVLDLEYRDEHDDPVTPATPWALFGNEDEWRAEPEIARGPLRTLGLSYSLDTRNEQDAPSAGWWIRARLEVGLGGNLTLPTPPDSGFLAGPVRPVGTDFRDGLLDLRRYARLGPSSRLSTRIFAAGSLSGDELPPQRQHALGGVGTLPAYPLFEFDCGAHRRTIGVGADTVLPYYGCDNAVLVQIEYAAGIRVGGIGRRIFGTTVDLSNAASWVVFFDAGRAWNGSSARQGRGGGQADFAADAGVGFRLGRIGIYWALPLSGHGQNANLFLRLDPRI
jgi:hypothetical protein